MNWPFMILRLALAFIFINFGIDSLINPQNWSGWFPTWLVALASKDIFTQAHGIMLLALGLLVLSGFKQRFFSAVSAVFMAIVIITVGYNEIAVRDFAIFSIALALAISKQSTPNIVNLFRK